MDFQEPSLIFEKQMGESITSVGHGMILQGNTTDLIVSTYSGKVIGMSEAPDEEVGYNDVSSQSLSCRCVLLIWGGHPLLPPPTDLHHGGPPNHQSQCFSPAIRVLFQTFLPSMSDC